MRVLLVQGQLMPEQMAHWVEAARIGVDLHVACAVPDSVSLEEMNSIAIHSYQPRGLMGRGHLWWIYPGLGDLVTDLNPDVVHVTAETYGLFYSQIDLTERRVAGHVVDNIWTHGRILERTIRLGRARRILKRLSGCASWNTAGLELARRFGLPAETPTVLFPARIASPAPFREAAARRAESRQALGFGEQPVVGFLGRLVPEKGVDWLIQSFAESQAAAQAELHVYGSGPAEPQLRRLSSGLRLPVHFGGPVEPTDVPRLLAAVDVLVVPSLTTPSWAEQFGRVIVEAMFAGTSVIASDSGSIPEVVGDGGVLVPEGDRRALSEAIDRLVLDPDRRSEMADSGTGWALSRFSPNVLGRRIVDFWERVQHAS